MALEPRTIEGTYLDANGDPLARKTLYVKPVFVFGSEGELVPDSNVRVTTDADGVYSFELLTTDVDDAYVRYSVQLHNQKSKKFDLVPGDSISLDELFNAYDPSQTAADSVLWLDHEARITELEENGGGGGGSIPFINEGGSNANISLAGGNAIPFTNEGGSAANIPLA